MIFLFLFLILFLGVAVGGFIFTYFAESKFVKTICCVAAILSTLAFIAIPWSFRTVDSGEIAVVKTMGKVSGTREAGVHFDFWMTNTYEKYDTKVRGIEVVTQSYSNDKQTMDVTMNLQYKIKREEAEKIAITYGSLSALESRIQSVAIERAKAVLSSYTADKIIMERATISTAVSEAVENTVGDDYFVDITMVALTNIDFSDVYEKAVEDKMVAEQAKLQKDYENQAKEAAAETDKKVKELEAEAAAEALRIQAEAEAKAIIVKAEAEAKALNIQTLQVAKMLGLTEVIDGEEVVKTNLTIEEAKLIKEYIEYIKYLETWDGKIPEVVTDGSGIIINP